MVELELVEDGWMPMLAHVAMPLLYCMPKRSHDMEAGVLVFPAASRPSIKSRISLDPKILFIILDIEAPILLLLCYSGSMAVSIVVGGDSFHRRWAGAWQM